MEPSYTLGIPSASTHNVLDMSACELPRPACEGMKRAEITELLDTELVRLVLTKRNAYSYWAHEVWLDRYSDHEKRIDFVEFVPKGGPTYSDAAHIEHGTFSFYEVKSCMADLRSGHGLNFEGDENWLVMPVEMFEPYKQARIEDEYVQGSTRLARCMLYGIGKNGKPTFWEQPKLYVNEWACRKRSASELLFCMMRAMIANSDHSSVSHHVKRM